MIVFVLKEANDKMLLNVGVANELRSEDKEREFVLDEASAGGVLSLLVVFEDVVTPTVEFCDGESRVSVTSEDEAEGLLPLGFETNGVLFETDSDVVGV